ncbi:hypothetical protein [Paucibacter soli]|uniref:hypothetical protein n=1 Tax=Paucibacter soli TaxID=3133433 RepID=UPI0030A5023B
MYPTIFELIDAADAEGVLRFTYPTYLNDHLSANRQKALAEMVERELHNAGFALPRIVRGQWADVVQAQATKNGAGEWEVRINLAKALLLLRCRALGLDDGNGATQPLPDSSEPQVNLSLFDDPSCRPAPTRRTSRP